eukprot:361126-Chlamydomonas_euryale.AAC.3
MELRICGATTWLLADIGQSSGGGDSCGPCLPRRRKTPSRSMPQMCCSNANTKLGLKNLSCQPATQHSCKQYARQSTACQHTQMRVF